MFFPDDFFCAGKDVFRVNCRGEWLYSVLDIIESITGNNSFVMKIPKGIKHEIINVVGEEKLFTDLAGVFRVILSMDHPNAEPFKMWLSNLGAKRVIELGGKTDG